MVPVINYRLASLLFEMHNMKILTPPLFEFIIKKMSNLLMFLYEMDNNITNLIYKTLRPCFLTCHPQLLAVHFRKMSSVNNPINHPHPPNCLIMTHRGKNNTYKHRIGYFSFILIYLPFDISKELFKCCFILMSFF